MIAELQNAARHIFRIVLRTSQRVGRPYFMGLPLVIVILPLLIAYTPASGQSQPEPPAQLCVEGSANCGSSGGGLKKWNPGHYLKTQGNHAGAGRAEYVSKVTGQLNKTNDSPEIRGALVAYSWGMLEPSLGNYDWGPIYTHLNDLSSRGKKMILFVETKCFSDDCANLAPSELASEVFVTDRAYSTQIIEIWEEQNMDLFIAFWRALAAEFDDNPTLEMISGSESSPSLQGGKPANYTSAGYAKQLERMYTAQAAAFKTTNVVASINFLSGAVPDLVEHAYMVGAGRGMPDTFDSDGSVIFRAGCTGGQCGVRDYRGLVPHFGIVSFSTLSGQHGAATDTPSEVISYGLANRVTHYAWISSLTGEDSWSNIISAIEGTSPNIYTVCPREYAEGCL